MFWACASGGKSYTTGTVSRIQQGAARAAEEEEDMEEAEKEEEAEEEEEGESPHVSSSGHQQTITGSSLP